jgi:hypothetical protein
MQRTILPLALGLIAVVVAIVSVRDRRAAQRELQSTRDAARSASARADNLDVEVAHLRKLLATATSQGVDDVELARLRAAATELKRLKSATTSGAAKILPATAATSPSAASTPKAAEAPLVAYSLEGTVRMGFGGMVVGGGWRLQEGRRAFLFASPTREESGSVMLDARLVEMPDAVVERFGLQDVVAGGRASEKFFIRDAAARAELIRNLEQTAGVDVLSGPRVLTRSGGDATIQVQGNPDSGEPGIRIGFTPTVQADGVNLDLGIKLKFLPE